MKTAVNRFHTPAVNRFHTPAVKPVSHSSCETGFTPPARSCAKNWLTGFRHPSCSVKPVSHRCEHTPRPRFSRRRCDM